MNSEDRTVIWYKTDYTSLDALYAEILRLIPIFSQDLADQNAIDCQNADDDRRIGLDPILLEQDTGATIEILAKRSDPTWMVSVPRGINPALLSRHSSERSTSSGESVSVHCLKRLAHPSGRQESLENRIDRVINRLVERAEAKGLFGASGAQKWLKSPVGIRRIAATHALVRTILTRPGELSCGAQTLLLSRGSHLCIRPIAERITITPVRHESRVDAYGDWGGARRILAESLDRKQRLFISEGHTRRVGKRTRSGYTQASLWLQGDLTDTLFGKNSILYQGLVTQSVLRDLGSRIDAGFRSPGLSDFLSIHQTVVINPS